MAYGQNDIEATKGTVDEILPVELVELNGVALRVDETLCNHVMEKPTSGVHLIVTTDEFNEVTVHLGPVWTIPGNWTQGIEGQPVHLVVFSTDKLPNNHFIAKELRWGHHEFQLRDGYLKPFWANRYDKEIW